MEGGDLGLIGPMLAMNYRRALSRPRRPQADPVIEHPGDAIVRVTRACICGSDLHLYHGLVPDTRVGHTFGHEFTGVVEEVGSAVQNLKPGDRVLVPFNLFCGSCFFCQKELYSNCHNTNPEATAVGGIYGYSHTTGGYDGGQAEYVRVPMADVGPDGDPGRHIHDDDAVLLTDALPTGYQAAEMGDISEGDTVVIFGAGPVGIFAAKSAWLLGAGRVIVVDHVEYRLDFVRATRNARWSISAGRRHGHPHQEDDGLARRRRVHRLRGLRGRGQLRADAAGVKLKLQAGAATVLHWCINSVRKGGNVSIVGVYGPTFNAVPIGNALNKGLTMRMNQASVKRHLPRLIEHIQAGRLSPSESSRTASTCRTWRRVPHVLEQARQLHQDGAGAAFGDVGH
jgi:threonine dehydrogenase-like Zn-dependent dehydrogenase